MNSESHPRLRDESSTDALPVAPSLGISLDAADMPRRSTLVDARTVRIAALAVPLGLAAALVAEALKWLINVATQLAFYGQWSSAPAAPAGHQLGAWVIVVPVIGGLIVGAMARWGSRAIRGHGIPEAMEQVLINESRIAPCITILKPLSSAIAIGTGGPFGAEGPIIATGGALGSLAGQLLHVTGSERKALLAAGAAAGMAAIFGAPVSAVILAVELLLFELRPRSLIPVAVAAIVATGLRDWLSGTTPVFAMPALPMPSASALVCYVALGALLGVVAVAATRIVYGVEDAFEKLPLHWMWWPALGGLAVGIVGYFAPLTLGVGYTNIEDIVNGRFALDALLMLATMKFLSWSLALGSGTSGGTLAPLFTIGGAIGGAVGIALASAFPQLGVDPRIAGLVGMAAIFTGASRALLTAVVFALETTGQASGLLPLLGGCTMAYLVSALLMRNTIMTEKIARRGVRVPTEYAADYLDQVRVADACVQAVISLQATQTLGEVRRWIAGGSADAQHQGYPVVDASQRVLGVLTRRILLDARHDDAQALQALITRKPVVVHDDHSLREAADHMVAADVGRLIVVSAQAPHPMTGILTRGDILSAHGRRLREAQHAHRHLRFGSTIEETAGKA